MLDRETVTDAIWFWERGRVVYNLLLALIFLITAGSAIFYFFKPVRVAQVATLAVVANVLYCAAYPVDLFIQMSAFRETWRKRRWILLAVGCLFAGLLAWLGTLALLAPILIEP